MNTQRASTVHPGMASPWMVPMTPAQKAHAEWALDPMGDFASDPNSEDEEFLYSEADLPTLDGMRLVFPGPSLAVDDILYRLTEQLRDMAEQAGKRYPSAAGTLAELIELTAARQGWVRTMGPGWREIKAAAPGRRP